MLEKVSYKMISKINNREVIQFIQDHLKSDPIQLVFESNKYPDLPIREIANQIASRQKAKDKLPEWYSNPEIIFPLKENLEQASSEITARFKSRWLKGKSILDLTGGIGVDLFYMSNSFKDANYVEPNAELIDITEYNFRLLRKKVKTFNTTAEEFLHSNSSSYDVIYLDPSRRSKTKKRVYGLEDYEPNVVDLYDALIGIGNEVVVKTSPMIDIKQTLRLLPDTYRVQVVAVDNEVKEVLFYINSKVNVEVSIEAWNISNSIDVQEFKFTLDEESKAIPEISIPRKYLYEPNSAIRKAGAFSLIATQYGLSKLHSNTHLYTSDEVKSNFPGRIFEIIKIIKPNKKEIKKEFPGGKVNVISKNFPMGTNEIKKKFRLIDGGDEFLIFCEVPNQKTSLRCSLIRT